jgi:hypothetical protein
MGSFWATGVVVMVGRKGSTQCLHHVPGVSARVIRGQKNEDGMREVAFPYAGAGNGATYWDMVVARSPRTQSRLVRIRSIAARLRPGERD